MPPGQAASIRWLTPAEKLILSTDVPSEAIALANDYINVATRKQALLGRIAELQKELNDGYAATGASSYDSIGGPAYVPIDAAKHQRDIHDLQLQVNALTMDEANFLGQLQSRFGDVTVPPYSRFNSGEGYDINRGGTGVEHIIGLALYARGYTGAIAGLEGVGGPLDLAAALGAGKLKSLASLEFAMPKAAQVTVNRAAHEAAVDDFAKRAIENGFRVLGREVSVRTPFGLRRFDLVLENLAGKISAIEIKSTIGAFLRNSGREALQQAAANRWVNKFGAFALGDAADKIGIIQDVVKIFWPAP